MRRKELGKLSNSSKATVFLLIVYDAVISNLAYGFCLWLRFDLHFEEIPGEYIAGWMRFAPAFSLLTVAVFALLRLYTSIWKHVSYIEMIKCFAGCTALALVHLADRFITGVTMPASYYAMGFIVLLLFLLGVRLAYRTTRVVYRHFATNEGLERILIIGAGEAGRILIRLIRDSYPDGGNVVCVVDDNPAKYGKFLETVPVKGTVEDVPRLVKEMEIDKVMFAIPSAAPSQKRRMFDLIKDAGCDIITVPSIPEMMKSTFGLSKLRRLDIGDLLGRDEVSMDNTDVCRQLEGKTVMITGGGGSIGSELVRQIAGYRPELLIVFDMNENNAFKVQQEVMTANPAANLKVIVGSVRDKFTVEQVLGKYRPQFIYHAAAHKHVPLMETVPYEAIKNNVIGTYNVAKAADAFGCMKFVLISTDKAVNPTNIMGASKRLCEMVVKAMNDISETDYAAVRFGNVLGSNGSVVPLFTKQIEAGGPVTVTHPEITRFFMTIPEAVSLVLQAGAFAKGGELFVLDMGESVKIADLARNMIRLAGFEPGRDISIEYTGLRPGEKLYEELLMDAEGLKKTENDLIYIGEQTDIEENFFSRIEELGECAQKNDDSIISKVLEMVPTYHPKNRGGV